MTLWQRGVCLRRGSRVLSRLRRPGTWRRQRRQANHARGPPRRCGAHRRCGGCLFSRAGTWPARM